MFEVMLNMLAMDDFYNVSEEIEIAKGKYKLPMTFSEGVKKVKRRAKWSQKR